MALGPNNTPFDALGGQQAGEARVRALVEDFYDAMSEHEPALAKLHRCDERGYVDRDSRDRFALFLVGWLGGPQHYTDRFGHPMLRARHLPQSIGGHTIGIRERDEWLACMDQAMGETGVPEGLRKRLRNSFFQTADWMRNR